MAQDGEKQPKIALVHEFLTQYGGAERVLQEFLYTFPDAPIYTLVHNAHKIQNQFSFYGIKESFLRFFPWARGHHRWFAALMPLAIESFDFKDYDIVLADASAFAKGVKVPEETTMLVCYCHTPTRYLWLVSTEYIRSLQYAGPVKFFIELLAPIFLSWLRRWDRKAAQRPHHYIANSKAVQARIKKYYNRDSVVVYPPVDTEFFHPTGTKENYFFAASRLEPYKKIELVIRAFNELELPLKIAGSGTASEYLRKLAKPNIEFLGRVSDEELRRRYSEAQAYIFPAEEDAGIMPIEAMACGTPVIAYAAGGALETVKDGETGVFFRQQSVEAIKKAVLEFKPEKFNRDRIRNHAKQFDKKVFREKINSLVDGWYKQFRKLT